MDLAQIHKFSLNPDYQDQSDLLPAEIASKYYIENAIPITEKYKRAADLPSTHLYEYVGTEYDTSLPRKSETVIPSYPKYKGEITFNKKRKGKKRKNKVATRIKPVVNFRRPV